MTSRDVCKYPDWEGDLEIGEHSWDDVGFCTICGIQSPPDGEAWCPICQEHMLTYDDKCVECGARTKPIGAK